MQKLLVFLCLTLGTAAATADEMPPSMVSFAELYRLTVSGASGVAPSFADAAPQAQFRVAALEASASAAPRFSVSGAAAPGRWALLFAGLAAFGWVAHRRLGRLF
jgi:hypothetical protein